MAGMEPQIGAPAKVQCAVQDRERATIRLLGVELIREVGEAELVALVKAREIVWLPQTGSPPGRAKVTTHQAIPVELVETEDFDLEPPG
jgi:hypothetical protein